MTQCAKGNTREAEDAAAEAARIAYEEAAAEEERWRQIHKADAMRRRDQKRQLMEYRKLPPRLKLRHPFGALMLDIPATVTPASASSAPKRTIIVVHGPPGSGHDALGGHLEKKFGLPLLVDTDLLASPKTPLQKKLSALEPAARRHDDVQAMLAERAAMPDCAGGCVFLSYPREEAQVGIFERWLRGAGERLSMVLSVEMAVDDAAVLVQPEVQAYVKQTKPVLEEYAEAPGFVQTLDASQPAEQIHVQAEQAIAIFTEGSELD